MSLNYNTHAGEPATDALQTQVKFLRHESTNAVIVMVALPGWPGVKYDDIKLSLLRLKDSAPIIGGALRYNIKKEDLNEHYEYKLSIQNNMLKMSADNVREGRDGCVRGRCVFERSLQLPPSSRNESIIIFSNWEWQPMQGPHGYWMISTT